jgi:hypothetical protein
MRVLIEWVVSAVLSQQSFWQSPITRWLARLGVGLALMSAVLMFVQSDHSSRSFTSCLSLLGLCVLVWLSIELHPPTP